MNEQFTIQTEIVTCKNLLAAKSEIININIKYQHPTYEHIHPADPSVLYVNEGWDVELACQQTPLTSVKWQL